MPEFFPSGPADVPADLTRPTAAYRRHAYVAALGLLFFLVLYFGLAAWFGLTTLRCFSEEDFNPIVGVFSGFLTLFMVQAVFFVRRGKHEGFEVEREQNPRLFAFLDRIADEAGAPRPHRVYLSPGVNAGVFYDLSLANLVFRSRKNLEIGLGLVNVLTLGEIKAVLAHEFGHFGQRSMAVGRWVYVAQQIAGHVVVARGKLDRLLHFLSGVDVRVAWVGWILRVIVWSIRSLVDTVFGWVILAERALSREMEFQADLVAVSLTGSDSLIHALHRLDAADDAMDRALSFTAAQADDGKSVPDLFDIQRRMLEKKRAVLDDPAFGEVPALPADPSKHRLFRSKLAHPPRMWSSHPPNEAREENAKKVYVAAPLDDRRGWELFENPEAIREQVTANLYRGIDQELTPLTPAQALAAIDQRFERRYFDPEYRGVYLGRSIARHTTTPQGMRDIEVDASDLSGLLESLYPASLIADVAASRELGEEKVMLDAMRLGILSVPGRVVQYRGEDYHRRELPTLVEKLEQQLQEVNTRLIDHDRLVRAAHLAAASTLSPSWADYLRGLIDIVHFAEHREADVSDAMESLQNVLSVVMADQKVTEDEVERLAAEAAVTHAVLEETYQQAAQVFLGPTLSDRLGVESFAASLGLFELPAPLPEYLGEWLDACPSWGGSAIAQLAALREAALDELLKAEEEVAMAARSGMATREAPPAPAVRTRYATMVLGNERPKQTRLGWWDRFQTADGFLPGVARFGVAGTVMLYVLWAAW